jgi:hypothetical protein
MMCEKNTGMCGRYYSLFDKQQVANCPEMLNSE